jgi:nifR3 family TIM-barrel protein
LTVKIRSGWESSGRQALEIARMAQGCGVDAIAVHPRTAMQGFGGRADWEIIARLRAALSIPVIGNGDITSAAQALAMLEQTDCAAVMIGRASIGNPWLFGQIADRLAGRPERSVALAERFTAMRDYLRASVEHCGEGVACRMMRSRMGWFTRGMPGGALFREAMKRVSRERDILALLAEYSERLEARASSRSPGGHTGEGRSGCTAPEALPRGAIDSSAAGC